MENGTVTAQRRIQLGGNTDTSWLKIVALVFMMIDHVDLAIFGDIAELRMLGRIALPIYAWCLVVGCDYTHNIFRYGFRLLVVAVISQPINMVALGNRWSELNILFLLCLGVIAIAGIQRKWYLSQFWAPALCFALLGFVHVDYGWKGLAFILLLYAARKTRGGLVAVVLAYAMFWGYNYSQIMQYFGIPLTFLTWPGIGDALQPLFRMQALIWLALPFILIPTRMSVKMPKWVGYGLYPAHLLLIFLIRLMIGEPPLALLSALWTI